MQSSIREKMLGICTYRRDHGSLALGINREPTSDEIVDISDFYYTVLRREHVGKGYFITSKAHRETIEHQITVYSQFYAPDDGFWAYISNNKRRAFLPVHRRIEEFVKLGIPPLYRNRLWCAMAGCQTRPLHCMAYSDLLEMPHRGDSIPVAVLASSHPIPALKEPYFTDRLLRVLTAFSLRSSSSGYSQQMTTIAGTLLVFLEEEAAFWILVQITDELLKEYFNLTMLGFHTDTQLLDWLICTNLPLLHKHFEKIHFSLGMLTSTWFVGLYIHDLPPETAFLVWDNIMLEGISVIFEIALAILNMVHDDIMQLNEESEIVALIHKRTKSLYDPTRLLKNWHVLDKKRIECARKSIRQKIEEEPRKTIVSTQLIELELRTHFNGQEIRNLWHQFDSLVPLGSQGFNLARFSNFIKCTLSEWQVDNELLSRLFTVTDVVGDGVVNFFELMLLLSVMCRGTPQEITAFNFKLFDMDAKGWIDKADLYRMLKSIYGMYDKDPQFHKMIRFFVDAIFGFDFPGKENGVLSLEAFEYAVSVQPQIMDRFRMRDPKTKFNTKQTFYYWLFAPQSERPNRSSEILSLSLFLKSVKVQQKTRKTSASMFVCS